MTDRSILAPAIPLGTMHRSIAHLFEERVAQHPERNFIGERTPQADGSTGDWRYITYGEANARADASGAGAARPRAWGRIRR